MKLKNDNIERIADIIYRKQEHRELPMSREELTQIISTELQPQRGKLPDWWEKPNQPPRSSEHTVNEIHEKVQSGIEAARHTPEYAEERRTEQQKWTPKDIEEIFSDAPTKQNAFKRIAEFLNTELAATIKTHGDVLIDKTVRYRSEITQLEDMLGTEMQRHKQELSRLIESSVLSENPNQADQEWTREYVTALWVTGSFTAIAILHNRELDTERDEHAKIQANIALQVQELTRKLTIEYEARLAVVDELDTERERRKQSDTMWADTNAKLSAMLMSAHAAQKPLVVVMQEVRRQIKEGIDAATICILIDDALAKVTNLNPEKKGGDNK